MIGFFWGILESTVAKIKLAIKPSDLDINQTVEAYSSISEAGARAGARTVLIIGPDKPSIYPEYLPDALIPSETRYVSFYLDRLARIPGLTVYDPTNDLLAAKKSEGLIYWKTDTHWNTRGAYLAYLGFCNLLEIQPVPVNFTQAPAFGGDLIGISKMKDFPLSSSDNWTMVWNDGPTLTEQEIPGTKINNTFGPARVITNKKPLSEKYVWVVGDSFSKSLRPYFNATFRQVRYVGHWSDNFRTLPQEINKADHKPDLIILVRVERSF